MKKAERVRDIVRAIPYGDVDSYGAISKKVYGHRGAGQAVGQAIKAHEDDDGFPWWRVVYSDGRLKRPGQDCRLKDEGVKLTPDGRVPNAALTTVCA